MSWQTFSTPRKDCGGGFTSRNKQTSHVCSAHTPGRVEAFSFVFGKDLDHEQEKEEV